MANIPTYTDIEPVYDPDQIVERGPWHVVVSKREESDAGDQRVYVASDDFNHDAMLEVTGDFYDDKEKATYAAEIARRLNAWPGTRLRRRRD